MLLLEQKAGDAAAGPAPDLYLVNRGQAAEPAALALARNLRRVGLSVELDASGAAFGKQFKRADRSGAAWAAVLGDAELEQGVVRLKPLRGEGQERELPLADVDALRACLMPRAC